MLIEEILKDKGSAVTTIDATETLQTAAELLDDKKIGAVVAVSVESGLAGVLSERDIARQVARRGADALSMSVADAMTRGVITATPKESVDACLSRMTDRRIRHLPIVQDGTLIGIISIGDLVKWKIDSVMAEAEAMTAYIKGG